MAEAAVAALVKIGVDAVVAQVVVAVAQVAITAGINQAIANNNAGEAQGSLINLTLASDEPRRLQIGKRLNGGVLVDWYVRGSKNQFLYLIIYHGEGPMGPIRQIYAGGRSVYNGTISHNTRTEIASFRSGGERMWITYHDGRVGQTANADLVSQGLGWTSQHVGDGMAYSVVEMKWDPDNLATPPSLSFEMDGAALYDRRLDSTAGGTGTHRIDDPDTWEVTDNPAVALDHYLLGRYWGGERIFGVGLDKDEVPYDRFAALANLCDEDVALEGGGTEKRYRAAGFLFADRTYKDTIMDLARAMNGRPADFGGRVSILDGQPRTPVLTIYDEDIIKGTSEQYSPKRSWGQLVGGVEGRFVDATKLYQPIDYPRVTDTQWETEDGGEPRFETVSFEMETSSTRAQRLAWLYAKRERRQAQLTGIYDIRTLELEQGDWFTRVGGKFGLGKTFEVINRLLNVQDMNCTITAFEVNVDDAAWESDTANDQPGTAIDGTAVSAALTAPSVTATPINVVSTNGGYPSIRFEVAASVYEDFPVEVVVQITEDDGSGSPSATGNRSVAFSSGMTEIYFPASLLENSDYHYRLRLKYGARVGDWSAWTAFTSTSAAFGSGDIITP